MALSFESGHPRGHCVRVQKGYDLMTKQIIIFPADCYAQPQAVIQPEALSAL